MKNILIIVILMAVIFLIHPSCAKQTGDIAEVNIHDMVFVSGGEFIMGDEESSGGAQPVHKVYLDAFLIDRTEVNVGTYRKCVEAGHCREPRLSSGGNWGWWRFGFVHIKEDHPVNYVSWYDADTYCKWIGKRLPTEAEWEKAARGTDGRRNPWGDEMPTCYYMVMTEITVTENEKAGPGCGRGSTWPVGSKPLDVSPYGVLDMGGNVSEWVGDWDGDDSYSKHPHKNPRGPSDGISRIYRGGNWTMSSWNQRNTATDRHSYYPNERWYDRGFRCARDAE